MKRILSMFLAATLIATMLSCVCGLSVSAATYDVAEAFASGTGTSDDPYVIETVEQLALLAQKVNSADENDAEYASACYKLGANIVMNNNVLKSDNMVNGTISKYGELTNLADGSVPFIWTPIGSSSKTVFSGVFDGDGHSISGMYSKGGYCGLFGFIKDATIKNLKLVDFYSYGTANEGNAGVATSAEGTTTFSDLWVNGHVSQFNNAMPSALLVGSVSGNVTFTNCISNGIAKGIDCRENTLSNEIPSYRSIGTATGFVGQLSQNANTVFDNCVNNASVFGGNAAGFVGLCYEGTQNGATVTFTDCINYGDITAIRFSGYGYSTERGIAGGFIAYGAKTGEVKMTRCLNAGIITGETYAGGFIGKIKNQSWLGTTYNHTLSNCYNIGNVSIVATPEQLAESELYADTTPYVDVLLAGDYIGYVELSQQYNDKDVNNWLFTDCSYIPCGCTECVNYEQGEKLTHTGEISEGSNENFVKGGWLGEDTSDWDTTTEGYLLPTLTLVTGGNAHIHNYSIVGNDPDCTNAGEKEYTCIECGYKFTLKKSALGHSYDEEITTDPGCTTLGEKTLTCSVCGDITTEPVDALGHDFDDGICKRCNQSEYVTVTVVGRNSKETSTVVSNGTVITLADIAPYSYGYIVTAWADGNGNVITDETITVIEDIKLVPTYSVSSKKYKLTVSGSTDDVNLTGEYYYNDKIKVVFDTTALGEGEYFSGWINAFTGEVISYKTNYTFYIGADATITANITTDESTAVPVVGITDVCDVNGDGSKYSFLMERSMPYKGYTYVSSGFIYSASEFSDPTDASLRKSVSTETALNAQYRLTVNLKNATDIYIVAFLTYEDAEGNQITIYSDEAPRHYTKTVS